MTNTALYLGIFALLFLPAFQVLAQPKPMLQVVESRCQSKFTGLAADPNDRHYFYLCQHGVFIRRAKCPEGSIFHEALMNCDEEFPTTPPAPKELTTVIIPEVTAPPETTEEPQEPVQITTTVKGIICPLGYTGLEEDLTDIHYFYVCRLGIVIMRSKCPEDSIFFKSKKACHPIGAETTTLGTPSIKPGTTEATWIESYNVTDIAIMCKHMQVCIKIFKDSEDCSRYYKCQLGELYHYRCPEKQLFDWKLMICVPSHRVHCPAEVRCAKEKCSTAIADPTDCQRSFHCLQGVPVYKRCPDGLLFNSETGTCDFYCRAKCIGKYPGKSQ